MKDKVAIIGYGYVGKGMHKIFPDACVYEPGVSPETGTKVDEGIDPNCTYDEIIFASKKAINEECKLAIVCVPTPPKGMGEQKVDEDETQFREVDLSIIEETVDWLETPLILIKSTIPPGTVDSLISKKLKAICFSPEYLGEGGYYTPPKYPSPTDPRKHDFMIVGGEKQACDDILNVFIAKLGPAKKYMMMTAVEAELIKYMENSWASTKVTFCNEWKSICDSVDASYNTVREGFLLDSRTEPMHTAVFPNKRGFDGKCLPKDLLGIIALSEKRGYEPKLLKEVWESNKRFLKSNK